MANNVSSVPGYQPSLGFVTVTPGSSADGIGAIPDYTELAVIQVEGGSVRYRDDGGSPTASVGMLLIDGQILESTAILSNLKFIQVTSGAHLNITYYGKN